MSPENADEVAYRAAVLRDIERHIAREGAHTARAHPQRARQFMPFAALKGYHELTAEQERATEGRVDAAAHEAPEGAE